MNVTFKGAGHCILKVIMHNEIAAVRDVILFLVCWICAFISEERSGFIIIIIIIITLS